jgi:hypothetical protein
MGSQLAEDIAGSGVHVVFDKWNLREGHDAIQFMERMVSDAGITKIILICDRIYKEKAAGRQGGAGTEAQIITPEIYATAENNKFCAVIAERDTDGKPYLPTYYKSRIYIDLSEDAERAANFEKLIRWLFDKPVYVRPELGRAPPYISDDKMQIQLHTRSLAQRATDAIKSQKPNCASSLEEYLTALCLGMEKFRSKEGRD